VTNGINTLNDNNPESSLSLGQLWEEKKSIHAVHLVRSPYDYAQYRIVNRIKFLFKAMGGETREMNFMNGWLPKPNKFVNIYAKTYKKICHRNVVKTVAVGGLEPAFLIAHRPDIHMFSIGPNIYDVHSPKEHVSIVSVARLYKTLIKFLSTQ
jgi:dipeptidase D